jgi:hypothetical protein
MEYVQKNQQLEALKKEEKQGLIDRLNEVQDIILMKPASV